EEDGWQDAPYQPGAFTINTGDLLARWSGDRWESDRHRVLPPQGEAPDEDLVWLVYFYGAEHDPVVEALRPPIGKPNACARAAPRVAGGWGGRGSPRGGGTRSGGAKSPERRPPPLPSLTTESPSRSRTCMRHQALLTTASFVRNSS